MEVSSVSSKAGVVERHTTFPHPPETVWRALTEKAKLSLWLHPATDDVKPIAGHRFAFVPENGNDAERIECRVVAADPEHRLSYTWQPSNGEKESIVTWTLEPIDGGTRVHLRHDGVLPGSAIPRLNATLGGGSSKLTLCHRRFRRFTVSTHYHCARHSFSGVLLCR